MRILFAMILALVAVAPATACINDRELPSHEREFRSQYEENDYVPTTAAEPESTSLTKYFVGGVGSAGVLLALAGSIVLLRMRGTQQA